MHSPGDISPQTKLLHWSNLEAHGIDKSKYIYKIQHNIYNKKLN